MKIAIFTDSFLPGVGGTEQGVFGLANALSANYDVMVACPNYHNKNYIDEFVFSVIRARSLKISKNDFMALPKFSRKFSKDLTKFQPDLVLCQSPSGMAAAGIRYAKKHNIPTFITIHTKFKMAYERSVKSKFIVNQMIKNIVNKLNKCDLVFTVSNNMAKELKNYGFSGDVTIVRNGTNFKKVENIENDKALAREKFHLNCASNIFLFVGRIVKYKNLQFILDALKIVKNTNPDFKMLFVGDGQDRQYFIEETNKLGLRENVIFTGKVNDEMLKSIYANANLFLFPSVFDTDGLVIVEASMYNVPSIVIENTGSSERIIDNVSGFVSKLDKESFADKILYCMSNKEEVKKVGQNASQMLPTRWADAAEVYINCYNSLKKVK